MSTTIGQQYERSETVREALMPSVCAFRKVGSEEEMLIGVGIFTKHILHPGLANPRGFRKTYEGIPKCSSSSQIQVSLLALFDVPTMAGIDSTPGSQI